MTRTEAFEALPDEHQAFLRDVADAFGKPVAIAIRFRGGERYDGGRFLAAQDYPDFKSPKPLWQRRRSR